MRVVGIKVLKNRLSEYIRLVASTQERILITDRDRVVAEIVPPETGRSALVSDSTLAEAVRNGWISPALVSGRRLSIPPTRKPVARLEDILKELSTDRDEK